MDMPIDAPFFEQQRLAFGRQILAGADRRRRTRAAVIAQAQVNQVIHRPPDAPAPVVLFGVGGVVAHNRGQHPFAPKFLWVVKVLPDHALRLFGRGDLPYQRVEIGGGKTSPGRGAEIAGLRRAVEKDAVGLAPQALQAGGVGRAARLQFLHLGASQGAPQRGQSLAVGHVQAVQPHIPQLHQVTVRVEGDVIVHRRVVQAGFIRRALPVVDIVDLIRAAEAGRVGRRPPAQQPLQAARRMPPAVPGQQVVEDAFHQPAIAKAPVQFAHDQRPDRRLGAVARRAQRRGEVWHQAALGALARHLDRVGVGQVFVVHRRQRRGEISIPLEQHIAAPVAVPDAADGGDDALLGGFVDRVPRQAGLDGAPQFIAGVRLVSRRLLLDHGLDFGQAAPPPGRDAGRPLQAQGEVGRLRRDLGV